MKASRWPIWFALPLLTLWSGVASAHPEDGPYRIVTMVGSNGVLVDEASVERDGDVRTFWTLQIPFMAPQAGEDTTAAYSRMLWRTDCARQRVRTLHIILYDEAGGVIEDNARLDGRWHALRGDGPHPLIDYICTGQLPAGITSHRGGTLAQVRETARQVREEREAAAPKP
jgi:hypothetical protein